MFQKVLFLIHFFDSIIPCLLILGYKQSHIREHIEIHLVGIKIECKICAFLSKTRNAIVKHKKIHLVSKQGILNV